MAVVLEVLPMTMMEQTEVLVVVELVGLPVQVVLQLLVKDLMVVLQLMLEEDQEAEVLLKLVLLVRQQIMVVLVEMDLLMI
tara:strand:- start:120 stop:362 length:243 start_codon:yes stop_codon:yes gene_type:complete